MNTMYELVNNRVQAVSELFADESGAADAVVYAGLITFAALLILAIIALATQFGTQGGNVIGQGLIKFLTQVLGGGAG